MRGGGKKWSVTGGRLGRDHTIQDVPRHYFRDCLMDYIDTQVGDQVKQVAARKAICPDLTDVQIDEYARLIAQIRTRKEEEIKDGRTREGRARKLVERDRSVKSFSEAMVIVDQYDTLQDISDMEDDDLDAGLCVCDVERNPSRPKPITRSVVLPNAVPLEEEEDIPLQRGVNKDCDQVRGMIKRFVNTTDWSLEEFRQALGRVSHSQMTTFLKKRGSSAGQKQSSAFILSWEFFHRRQYLELPLCQTTQRDDVYLLTGAR